MLKRTIEPAIEVMFGRTYFEVRTFEVCVKVRTYCMARIWQVLFIIVLHIGKMGKSVIWKSFTKHDDGKYARCIICKSDYRTSGNTSNLIDHAKRKHSVEYKEAAEEDAGSEDEENEATGEAGPSAKKQRKITIKDYINTPKPYEKENAKKLKLDSLLVKMIAQDLEPFEMIEYEGFKYFVHELDKKYQLLSRNKLKETMIPEAYNVAKAKLADILNSVSSISLTTDMWTSPSNDGIITLTAHFVHNNCLRSAVLETQKIVGSHTAEHICRVIEEILLSWNIRNEISAIVTDNGANVVKAADLFQIRHLPCFVHTLNLVVSDVLKMENVAVVLNHVKQIVTYFRSSTVAMDKLRELADLLGIKPVLKLIQDTPTRWNSTLYMIQRILQVYDALLLAIASCPKAPPPLRSEEKLLLEDLVLLLNPFELATKDISGDQYITISLILPLIHGITTRLHGKKDCLQTELWKQVFTRLEQSISHRLSHYESRTPVILAVVLDPRFKMLVFQTQDQKQAANRLLINMVTAEETNLRSLERVESTPESSHDVQSIQETEDNDLLSFIDQRRATTTDESTSSSDAIILARQYLELPALPRSECQFEFWKEHKSQILPNVAYKFLAISGSSVPSERMFSKAGLILNNRRNNIKPKRLNMLLFLKQNSWL